LISKALATLTPSLRDVAGWITVNYATLRSYKIGERNAPGDVVQRLASALRQQAARLVDLAERLESYADRD
jgi:hypothetical protein